MRSALSARICPFCGVVTDVPHDTQESCIEALQAEIARVRGILRLVKGPGLAIPTPQERDIG